MNFNKAILIGRLTKDPELRALPNGQNVASFSLATNRYFNDKSGQRQENTEFHNIVLFGRLADIASQYLKKGSVALIEGRIQTRSWQDNEGHKKYKTEIVGESIQLGPKNTQETEQSSNQLDKDEIPIIQKEEEEIDIKDIPF